MAILALENCTPILSKMPLNKQLGQSGKKYTKK